MAEGFTVNDRRGSRRHNRPNGLVTANLNTEMTNLRKAGHTLPKSDIQARLETKRVKNSVDNKTLTREMGRGRTGGTHHTASNVQLALPKLRAPMSSLEDKNIPYETHDPKQLAEIRRWARIFYTTHDLVPLLVDIYSKFPLVGLEFNSKDPEIKKFYETQFFDTLDYDNFLPDLGREYWISGEVTSLAHFSESLGVWESEEILNPEMVHVSRSLFKKQERVQLLVKDMVDALRDNMGSGDLIPESERMEKTYEYEQLKKYYPELIEAAEKNDGLDISDALVSRMVNRTQAWDTRGTPHLLRSFRTLMLEESLNAAQDAVADRLYSPFILAKLGAPDLGDGQPWIPDQGELEDTRDDLQTALAADFRLMVHNFGLDVSSVFGRESVPRFDADYDRVDDKLLQSWGIGKSLISGASGGPYASSALNREFVTQMMVSFQNQVKKHILKRAEIVAEAQGHYDYESSGGHRTMLTREIVDVDPDTGEERIITVPKLLLPDISFSTLNLRDEAQERSFLQALKGMGVPISDQSLAVNIPIEFEQELEKQSEETVAKLVAEAQAMKKAYDQITAQGLPTPPDLAAFLVAQSQLEMSQDEATMSRASAEQANVMSQNNQANAEAEAASAAAQQAEAEMAIQQMQNPPPPEQSFIVPEDLPTDSLLGPSQGPQMPPTKQIAASVESPYTQERRVRNERFSTDLMKPFKKLPTLEEQQKAEHPELNQEIGDDYKLDDADEIKVEKNNPTRSPESDEMRSTQPKTASRVPALINGPSTYRSSYKAIPRVSDLVQSSDLFEVLNQQGYQSQIQNDWPELEELYQSLGGDIGSLDPGSPYFESFLRLSEMLEQYSAVFGVDPIWN